MARQMLNVQIAINLSANMGIDWLIHIDIDELFYVPGNSVIDHFIDLENRGISNVKYLNLESISTSFDASDFFKEIKHFKLHPSLLNLTQQNFIKNQVRYLNLPLYYLFYMNGKSAAKISKELLPVCS